ncbi:MAG: protein kinase domain-containing protein [Beutenbergiaceae bacterium]
MTPQRGLTLGGRYELVDRIAIGGMGEVWTAIDRHLARTVAAKVLRTEFTGDASFLNRMRAEARNTAGLSHGNITAMYDYGEQDGASYLIMEYVEGEPMSDLLTRESTLSPAQLLPILAQTARGLHAAHLAGVVHRDVKPSNLLITRDGTVKITDFGIALGANQAPMTAAGMVMGTAQYLPPEQAMGKAAQGVGDIYALGIIGYESLAGKRPFTGTTQVDIAFAHVNQPVPPLPDSVDPRVREVVMSMLEKDPERRPRSGASLGRVLEDLHDHLTADDRPGPGTRTSTATVRPSTPARSTPARSASPSKPRRTITAPVDGSAALALEPSAVSDELALVEPAPREPDAIILAQVRPAADRTAKASSETPEAITSASPPATRRTHRAANRRRPVPPRRPQPAHADASTALPLPRWAPVPESAARAGDAPTTRSATKRNRHRGGSLAAGLWSWRTAVKVLALIVMVSALALLLGTLASAQAAALATAGLVTVPESMAHNIWEESQQ